MKQTKLSKRLLSGLYMAVAAVTIFALGIIPTATARAISSQSMVQQDIFTDAAKEFQVPIELLMAVSYYQSRWENHNGEASVDGGFGPMNLRTTVAVEDGRGDSRRPIDPLPQPSDSLTLDRAAQILQVPLEILKKDTRQNIRGGAAVLAERAKAANGGTVPSDMNVWYMVAARYLGNNKPESAQLFIDEIYKTLKEGRSATTSEGQHLTLVANPSIVAPSQSVRQVLGITQDKRESTGPTERAECPQTITCRFIPAGYAANSSNPADYGNYDHSNRPKDMKIKYIVIHNTEGSYTSAISHFQDTTSYVSAHYVIRSSDGDVTQMVDTKDTAWHAGDWYVNMHSIGVEHEGVAAQGGKWYTEAMYRSSANLVKYLAKKYDIPLDREHIIGHDNVPGLTDRRVPTMHWDPGPYWDWNHYMELLTGKPVEPAKALTASSFKSKNAVTINPTFSKNIQTVNACEDYAKPETCADQSGPSAFVYLRTAPNVSAPLITDPLIHPDGSPGTNRINDWTAKATTGQQFALAERQGDWTAIWFANQKAWFYNPASQPTATPVKAKTVRLKSGIASTNMYGGAYPEASAYPADVPGPAQPKLSYIMTGSQKYVSYGIVPTDYFYDATIDYSKPHDHEIFKGSDKFIQIWYNHRVMYVRASDVVIE